MEQPQRTAGILFLRSGKREITQPVQVFFERSCRTQLQSGSRLHQLFQLGSGAKRELHVLPERQRCFCSLRSYARLFTWQGSDFWQSDFVRGKSPCCTRKRRELSRRTNRLESSRSTRSSIRWSIGWRRRSKSSSKSTSDQSKELQDYNRAKNHVVRACESSEERYPKYVKYREQMNE